MKKLLLSTVAVCGVAALAAPANAQVSLELGGYTKLYGVAIDQDTRSDVDDAFPFVDESVDERDVDILRDTEVHLTGETTLDNGLTVGAHFEMDADNNTTDDFTVEEAYAYFSGGWGRFNIGSEDGAQYLLQVAAPSADSNLDGIRQFIQPVDYTIAPGTESSGALVPAAPRTNTIGALFDNIADDNVLSFGADRANGGGDDVQFFLPANSGLNNTSVAAAFDLFTFDYDNDVTGYSDKVTYLSPILNGFQLGLSYTPEVEPNNSRGLAGVNNDDTPGQWGSGYEISARYEGQFNNVGVILGAGYALVTAEEEQVFTYIDNNNNEDFNAANDDVLATFDDRDTWNLGLDLNIGAFGVGAAYTHDDLGLDGADADRQTYVVGVDYTTGPFKIGASWLNNDQELDAFYNVGDELDTDRYTGGVVYTYGPGMTFRGTVSYIETEVPDELKADNDITRSTDDIEATTIMLGTQINF